VSFPCLPKPSIHNDRQVVSQSEGFISVVCDMDRWDIQC